jgi:hypothetical protein
MVVGPALDSTSTSGPDPREDLMRALVVYESMFGNTHVVADRIGTGVGSVFEVVVTPVDEAEEAVILGADLLIVGGPTHVHGMTSETTRKSAVDVAAKDDDLDLDPDAEGPGLREWFHGLPERRGATAAAFDTRVKAPVPLTGRASKGIARRLRRHGFALALDPESFLVDKENHLIEGEAQRAEAWGAALAAAAAATIAPGARATDPRPQT